MLEFNNHDYHNNFIKQCTNQSILINTEIHTLLKDMYLMYYKLQDNYNYLVKYNIKIHEIIRLEIKGTEIDIIITSTEEQLFISNYNFLLNIISTINKLSILYKQYSFYRKIPYNVFKVIMYATNFEITRLLLKGQKFTYPILGEVYIARVPYDSSFPDWGASYKFKEFLDEQGIQTKDKDNENGKAWLVDNGLNRDDFVILRWKKFASKLHNKAPYRLVPCTFGNIYGKILKRTFTIKELLQNTSTGIFDKIIHMYRYHYEYTQSTFPYVNIASKQTEHNITA